MLNPQSPQPLYRQLALELANGIAAGQYGYGERIPSEPALAALHKIGRPTVRQATELLVRKGLVERRRGAGTYVKRVEPQVSLFDWGGTLAAFEKSGLSLQTVMLQRPTLRNIDESNHPLHGRRAYCLVRLGRLDDVPVLLEQMSFDAEVFPGLHQHSLKGQSLSRLVERVYHRVPSSTKQSFSVGNVEKCWAHSLQITPSAPLLVVRRIIDFPGAAAASTSTMYCRTDRVAFTQTLPVQTE
jgi:GntR family transcriptional regulator